MTAKELASIVGRVGEFATESGRMRIHVRVVDVRIRYGITDYLVRPVGGIGEAWVLAERVKLEPSVKGEGK